ncbi:MAG: hypothetical protein SNH79_07675 [Rikenellaceae bacterium]
MKQEKERREKSPIIARYSVNFTEDENKKFMEMFVKSGAPYKAKFIKARVFNEHFRVITIDRTYVDYYQKLHNLITQFRQIGNNYNQAVVVLREKFSEQTALKLLYKLEKQTLELTIVAKEIALLSTEFREKWLQK